jgi:hypothetical protein
MTLKDVRKKINVLQQVKEQALKELETLYTKERELLVIEWEKGYDND